MSNSKSSPKKRAPRKSIKAPVVVNNCWDELHALSATATGMINATAKASAIFRDQEGLAKIINKADLYTRGAHLLRDLTELSGRLAAIKAKHVNLTGGTNDPDDNMAAIAIGSDYAGWMDDYNLVIVPTINAIDAIINETPPEPVNTFSNSPDKTNVTPTKVAPAIDLMKLAAGK